MSNWWTKLSSLLFDKSAGSLIDETPPRKEANRTGYLVTELLSIVCSKNAKLIMNNTELSSAWPGVFKTLDDTFFTIEIKMNEVRAMLGPGAVCAISFEEQFRPHVFLTTVKRSKIIHSDVIEVEFFLPDAIQAAGKRTLYRVPVPSNSNLIGKVALQPGKWFDSSIKDINAHGARISLRADVFDRIQVGDEVYISFRLENLQSVRAADIRYTDARTNSIGVHFLLTANRKSKNNLLRIIREAEIFYIRQVQRQH
ncbi:MAG: hypothetical protein ACI9UK_001169 [Candidatus Krumholzibacteriia bacterium]|jgi:hypothetical protein